MMKSKTVLKLCRFLPVAALLLSTQIIAQDGYTYSANKGKNRSANNSGLQDTNEKQSLITVLKELNRLKGVYFLYSEKSMSQKLVNPLKDLNNEVETILEQVLKNTGLKYKKISPNTFVIVSETEKTTSQNYVEADLSDNKADAPVKFEQIRGTITDNNNVPLAGVTVAVKGSTKGTSTNSRGEFAIEANKGDILLISYVGYEAKEVQIGDDKTM